MEFVGLDVYSGKHRRITVEGGLIAAIEDAPVPQDGEQAAYLSRGFIDAQVNGYRGVDYSGKQLTVEEIGSLVGWLAESGTLRHIPTLITGGYETTRANLALIRRAREEDEHLRAAIPGVHLEGPYISELDGARGAHDAKHVRDPDIEELKRWQEAAGGLIRLVTVAPERPGAVPFIRQAVDMGITVSLGHCLPDDGQLRAAVEAGATMSTHLGNGSPGMLPRLKNHLWSQMAEDRLWAGLIADGFHLPAPALTSIARAKGLERIVLVSDVGSLGGLKPGLYHWGDIKVEVHPDGHLGLAGTEYLAGAGHLLDTCLPFFIRAAGCTMVQAVALVTDHPVRALKLDVPTGPWRVGEAADIVRFQAGGDRLRVLDAALGGWSQAYA
ncbi:MAG: amidohydrolase family protein [Clostridiales bacterium]|nr:amidohydrolase family protein [Clostridiales bacterium]